MSFKPSCTIFSATFHFLSPCFLCIMLHSFVYQLKFYGRFSVFVALTKLNPSQLSHFCHEEFWLWREERETERDRERQRRLKTGNELLCRHSECFVKVAAQTWSTLLLCVAETVLSGQCRNLCVLIV